MELLKKVYFCSQKSIIKAGNNKFHDLINAPRMLGANLGSLLYRDVSVMWLEHIIKGYDCVATTCLPKFDKEYYELFDIKNEYLSDKASNVCHNRKTKSHCIE